MAVWFGIMSGVAFYDSDNYDPTIGQFCLTERLLPVSVFLCCAFQISTALQLFNWFSKRFLGTVLGVWLSAQCFGLMTKFAALKIYRYFPSLDYAEQTDVN